MCHLYANTEVLFCSSSVGSALPRRRCCAYITIGMICIFIGVGLTVSTTIPLEFFPLNLVIGGEVYDTLSWFLEGRLDLESSEASWTVRNTTHRPVLNGACLFMPNGVFGLLGKSFTLETLASF